jgi:hypothetical protein
MEYGLKKKILLGRQKEIIINNNFLGMSQTYINTTMNLRPFSISYAEKQRSGKYPNVFTNKSISNFMDVSSLPSHDLIL